MSSFCLGEKRAGCQGSNQTVSVKRSVEGLLRAQQTFFQLVELLNKRTVRSIHPRHPLKPAESGQNA